MPANTPRYTFHIVSNSHLDPVWLWDWREGLNEALLTVRTVLRLMDEFPALTYSRGETVLYEHLLREEPATFARIQQHVKAGRWDPIGGAYLQPDTNMPATETFARIYLHGQRFFKKHFGRTATAAWAADSFGHSAGMPEMLAGAGFRYFSFCRPFAEHFTLPTPVFYWEGAAGSRILAYRPICGWYGSERDEMPKRLDGFLAAAEKQSFHNIGVFHGLGNHGGGPTRRSVRDILAWAETHPEVKVVFSGLHPLFAALEKEIAAGAKPGVVKGELNFVQRGCYASAARLKFAFRQAEAALSKGETAATASHLLAPQVAPDLGEAWRGLMFNSFHDILPGSSIERALDEQVDWTRGLLHTARKTEFNALNALARRVDTTVPAVTGDHPTAVPLLVWNPLVQPRDGLIELEASLDYRPIWPYDKRPADVPLEVRDAAGKLLPFQRIKTEHNFAPTMPWRARVVVPASLPALGWSVFTIGWVEGAKKAPALKGASAPRIGEIANRHYRISAKPGADGIDVFHGRRALLTGAGLGAITVEDPYGSWGDMSESAASINLLTVRHAWKVVAVETLEHGPLRAALWVKLAGGSSELELTFRLGHEREVIDVEARVLWNERNARLKLVFPGVGDHADFDVAGAVVHRKPSGDVPGGRWVRTHDGKRRFGFASDALYCFDASDKTLRATVVRSTFCAKDETASADTPASLPPADRGEYRFRFLLTTDGVALPQLAADLEQPPTALLVPPHDEKLARSGSIASLEPAQVHLLALKPAEDGNGLIVRFQETAGTRATPRLTVAGKAYKLASLAPLGLATYRLHKGKATPVLSSEEPKK